MIKKLQDESFGDYFRKLRKANGFKWQKDLAEASGVSQTTISRIEDNSQKPTPDTLRSLSKTLNVPYDDLMIYSGNWGEDELSSADSYEHAIREKDSFLLKDKDDSLLYAAKKKSSKDTQLLSELKKIAEEHNVDLYDPRTLDILKDAFNLIKRVRGE